MAIALEYLFGLFADEQFKIRDIKDPDKIYELADFLNVHSTSTVGQRSMIGKELSRLRGIEYRASSGTVRLEVCSDARGSVPAIYRVVRTT